MQVFQVMTSTVRNKIIQTTDKLMVPRQEWRDMIANVFEDQAVEEGVPKTVRHTTPMLHQKKNTQEHAVGIPTE